MFRPDEDGITHINIYSQGLSPLGRVLSNFAFTPFTHPIHGRFCSIEGYWFWLQTKPGFKREALRFMSGVAAKNWGTSVREHRSDECRPEFRENIKQAVSCKCYQNYDIYKELKASTLPLIHKYVYGRTYLPTGFDWTAELWVEQRKILQAEEK